MKRSWIETEIKDFLGIATGKINRQKNEAQEILNLDLRERTGAIVQRSGYTQKYSAFTDGRLKNVSYLAAENIYIPDFGGGRECTVVVAKGELEESEGTITPKTINVPLIFMRPSWRLLNSGTVQAGTTSSLVKTNISSATNYVNCYLRVKSSSGVPAGRYTAHFRKITKQSSSSPLDFTIDKLPYAPLASDTIEIWGWVDQWDWINEMIYSKIGTYALDSENSRMSILYTANKDDHYWFKWTITNLTKNEHSTILHSTDTGFETEIAIADANNAWEEDDLVLIQRHFIPLEYLYKMGEITAKDISFYRVLNDLRIAFGGQPGRLALALGMINRSLQVSQYPPSYPSLAGQLLVSLFSQRLEVTLNPINTTSETGTYQVAVSDYGTGTFPIRKFFYKITAFLDDHSEFLLIEGNHTIANANYMRFIFKAAATLNKRVTAIRFWLSEGLGTLDSEASNPFFLVSDVQISQLDTDYDKRVWQFDNDGFLYFEDYISYDNYKYNGGEIQELLGYEPTFDYANSFDHALVINRSVFAANPYSDKRWDNLIYKSPVSGETVFQYDALTASNYLEAEINDTSEIIGTGLLNNLDLAVLKKNIYSQLDSESGRTYQTHLEKGAIARRSIINTGNGLIWAGERGIIAANTQEIMDIADGSISDQYRALTTKEDIIAAREEQDNAYRFFTGDTTNKTEFVFTKRGWVKHVRYNYPDCYIQTRDGSVWFMRSGVIYNDTTATRFDVDQAYTFRWKSIPLDIALLGEEIKDRERFLVNSVWIRYRTNSNFTMKVYLDGSETEFQSFTVRNNQTYESFKLYAGANCRIIEVEFTGSIQSYADYLEILAIGIIWTPIKVGLYAHNN